jgi:thioredoxin 1
MSFSIQTVGLKRNLYFGTAQNKPSLVKQVTDKTSFDQEIQNSTLPVLVKFSAPWCGFCQAVHPAVEKAAKDHQNKIKVIEAVLWDQNNPHNRSMKRVAGQYKIQSVPTFILFRNGQETMRGIGAPGLSQILQTI